MTFTKNKSLAPPPLAKGILLVDKPTGRSSFSLIPFFRKRLGVKKIGHAGTLDPFATGLMVYLIGKEYTQRSDSFLQSDKQYLTTLRLGIETDTHDIEGSPLHHSNIQPSLQDLQNALHQNFQGTIFQVPPMYSAKKIQGQTLYKLARQGKKVSRPPVEVRVKTTLESYHYPYLNLNIHCSKGCYIRALARDLGRILGCYAHLSTLCRVKSGDFLLKDCQSFASLENSSPSDWPLLQQSETKPHPNQ